MTPRNGPRHSVCTPEKTYLADIARNLELGFRVIASEWEENEGPNRDLAVVWRAFKFRVINVQLTVKKVA